MKENSPSSNLVNFSFTFLGPFFGFGHHCFFVFFCISLGPFWCWRRCGVPWCAGAAAHAVGGRSGDAARHAARPYVDPHRRPAARAQQVAPGPARPPPTAARRRPRPTRSGTHNTSSLLGFCPFFALFFLNFAPTDSSVFSSLFSLIGFYFLIDVLYFSIPILVILMFSFLLYFSFFFYIFQYFHVFSLSLIIRYSIIFSHQVHNTSPLGFRPFLRFFS